MPSVPKPHLPNLPHGKKKTPTDENERVALTTEAGAPTELPTGTEMVASLPPPPTVKRKRRKKKRGPMASPVSSVAPPGFKLGPIDLNRNQTIAMCITGIVIVGLTFGLIVDPPPEDPQPYGTMSSIIGWLYFSCWSLSFVPQIYLNYRRQSVVGQSFDFVYLNVIGFTAYFVYNSCLFSVKSIREDYASVFHHENNVAINDVFYALFALTCTLWNAWQIAVYDRGGQTAAKPVVVICIATVIFFLIWACAIVVFGWQSHTKGPLGFLYGLSLVKFGVTLVKYIPQVLLNRRRRLTIGWNIWNVLLDFTGGLMSTFQEVFDAGVTGHWNGLIGNAVKLGLGLLAMTYNIIFMIQHFFLYKRNNRAVIQAIKIELAGHEEDATQIPRDAALAGAAAAGAHRHSDDDTEFGSASVDFGEDEEHDEDDDDAVNGEQMAVINGGKAPPVPPSAPPAVAGETDEMLTKKDEFGDSIEIV